MDTERLKLNDNRLYDFIAGRQWEPFHAASIYKATHSLYFYALRDTSGEYLLVYLSNAINPLREQR